MAYAAAAVSPHADADLPDTRLTAAAALTLLGEVPATAAVGDWDAPLLVAYCGGDLLDLPAPAWRCTGRLPTGNSLVAYVDAVGGGVLAVRNMTVHAQAGQPQPVSGTVRGSVLPGLIPYWGSAPVSCPNQPALSLMANVEVRVVSPTLPSPVVTYTDSNGRYALIADTRRPMRLEARLAAPSWETTSCFGGGFSCFPFTKISVQSGNVREGGTANLTFALPTTEPAREFAIGQMTAHAMVAQAHTHMASRGVLSMNPPYLHVWVQHEFVSPCNALYDLTYRMIRTPSAMEGCPNTAFASVMTHEWGHYFAHAIMGFSVETPGTRSFHEGYADSLSVLVHDSPLIGPNVQGCGEAFRDLSNPRCVYPGCPGSNNGRCRTDPNVNIYDRSEILSGVWWDLRQSVGLETARLLHAEWSLATLGPNPGTAPCGGVEQAAGPDTLLEVATVDDDDGNLANGTPHSAEICAAFLANGISPDPGLTLCGESAPGSPCLADCDTSTGLGIVDIFDLVCFMERFNIGHALACDCDTLTGPGRCDIFDVLCFQAAWGDGCP